MVGERTWKAVTGFGIHIKSTPTHLILQRGEAIETIPLDRISHLLIIGAHMLQSVVVTHLLNAGSAVTFFDADSRPVGSIRPYGNRQDERMRALQEHVAPQRYALEIAKASTKARLYAIERTMEETGEDLFLKGEYEVLTTTLEELDLVVTLAEIRRLHRLARDMYYEIMARSIPRELGFSRRTKPPFRDPVNSLLSLGYAILEGVCLTAVIGADLDPDLGILHRGRWGLVRDLIEPVKPKFVDIPVFSLARSGIDPGDYETSYERCYLSDSLSERLSSILSDTISRDEIDRHVTNLLEALIHRSHYTVPYW
ncbi:MAG: CRISPR-associated endonuclease Cas1 [Methanoculleaceae archaeon]